MAGAVATGAWSLQRPRPSSSISALVFLVLGDVTPSWSSLTRGSEDRGLRLGAAPGSPCPGLGLGLETGLGPELARGLDSSGVSLGLGLCAGSEEEGDEDDLLRDRGLGGGGGGGALCLADGEDRDDDRGAGEALALAADDAGVGEDSLRTGPAPWPNPRLDRAPAWGSDPGLALGVEVDPGLEMEEEEEEEVPPALGLAPAECPPPPGLGAGLPVPAPWPRPVAPLSLPLRWAL